MGKGKQSNSVVGEAYLYYGYDEPQLGIKKGEEASPLDKKHFFCLMNSILLTPEYFKPFPKGCPKPNYIEHPSGTIYHYITVLFDDPNNAEALYGENSPVGTNYILVNEDGLKAELFIQDTIKDSKRIDKSAKEFRESGTIEGFTSLRNR